ncbi:MAG: type II toxin-antitoxin system VapC family toxin [Leptospiraceae bacterium]|nr:type II toxin-antitoxin system VapC family toxin [Leptospiraceae bacterium]
MNGNKFFIDTNIVLNLLNGDLVVKEKLESKEIFLSFITELELLSFQELNRRELKKIENFLSDCNIIDISSEIKKRVIEIRTKHRIKLPDAIILCSAIELGYPLLTADKKLEKIYRQIIQID